MKIEKTSFYNNPFAGLFLKTNNSLTLVPKNAPEKLERQVESVLKTKALRLYVDQSPLLGIFTAMNDSGCIVSEASEKHEQSLLKKEGLNVCILKTYSPGNNILANNKACLLNPEIPSPDAKRIGDCLGVEVVKQKIGIRTVGATNVVTDKGLLAHNETSEIELKYLEKVFSVKGIVGTSNFGQTYNGFSITANNHGALVGNTTTGIEMQRIFEALGG